MSASAIWTRLRFLGRSALRFRRGLVCWAKGVSPGLEARTASGARRDANDAPCYLIVAMTVGWTTARSAVGREDHGELGRHLGPAEERARLVDDACCQLRAADVDREHPRHRRTVPQAGPAPVGADASATVGPVGSPVVRRRQADRAGASHLGPCETTSATSRREAVGPTGRGH